MKAILEFNLPEDREAFNDAVDAQFNAAKIETLYDEVFRPHLKHWQSLDNGKELSELEFKVIEKIWHKISNHFNGED